MFTLSLGAQYKARIEDTRWT